MKNSALGNLKKHIKIMHPQLISAGPSIQQEAAKKQSKENGAASIVMGSVVVECNPTEDSVVVLMLIVDSPKLRGSRNIERNTIQVQPSGDVHLMFL